MFGRDSSEYYDDDGEEEEIGKIIKSDVSEIFLYVLWIIFIFLIIPSIISSSIYYTTIKYPLDELRYTIDNNRTFEDDAKLFTHFNLTKKYKCLSNTSVSEPNIKQELMNGNIILLQTHRFITDNENARSLAGSFEFKSDTYCFTNIAENYLLGGYETMQYGGVYLAPTRYGSIVDEKNQYTPHFVQLNTSFSISNWKHGTEVKSIENVIEENCNINVNDVYYVESNKNGCAFVLNKNGEYCFKLVNKNDGSKHKLCHTRVWIENRLFDINHVAPILRIIYIEFDVFSSMVALDTNMNAILCTPE